MSICSSAFTCILQNVSVNVVVSKLFRFVFLSSMQQNVNVKMSVFNQEVD